MAQDKAYQLVVAMKAAAELRMGLMPGQPPSATAGDVGALSTLLASPELKMRPVFGPSEDRIRAVRNALPPATRADVPDLSTFYVVDAPDEHLEYLADRFRELDLVEYAYLEPRVYPAVFHTDVRPRTAPPPPPSITPDFSAREGYLDGAPGGIDARFAWTLPGGRGAGVNIIDIEGAWQLTHEDLLANQGGLISGTQSTDPLFRRHGTAVLGVLGADDNGFGVVGIAPDANCRVIAAPSFPSDAAAAIGIATGALATGDIILIEQHAPGPRFGFQVTAPGSQLGFVAMQYWPVVFASITAAAVLKNILVVEAAGNGAENLDDPLYSTPPPFFPPGWAPFDRTVMDNGSIIVGAGACPPGTHGRGPDADRSRMSFSNFGSCLDAQGWGTEVTTCGWIGDLQGGMGISEDLWYTDVFNGTSSASPIVAGALACIQGALKAAGKPLLTPIAARQLLRNLGSVQQDTPGRPASERIGNRPDLFLMLSSVV
jgi:Subtilase family